MNEANEGLPDGLAQIRAMIASGQQAPIGETLNFHLVKVDRGLAVFEGTPDRSVYNPLGTVHGGYFATLLDSACGVATHTTLDAGHGYTTLELKISYLRGLSVDSGTVRATGRVVRSGRRVAFAEAVLHDGSGRLCATATSTLLVFDAKPGSRGALAARP
ncbi:PaaI family thioesterase [Sphingobium sp. TomTYG45]